MPTSGAACNIIVDSCCELSRGYCERAGLRVLNFSYTETVKGDDGLTGVDDMYESTSAHDFYEAMRHGAQPMTSQPSQLAFETAFNEAIDSGVPTVYLAFSSGFPVHMRAPAPRLRAFAASAKLSLRQSWACMLSILSWALRPRA